MTPAHLLALSILETAKTYPPMALKWYGVTDRELLLATALIEEIESRKKTPEAHTID